MTTSSTALSHLEPFLLASFKEFIGSQHSFLLLFENCISQSFPKGSKNDLLSFTPRLLLEKTKTIFGTFEDIFRLIDGTKSITTTTTTTSTTTTTFTSSKNSPIVSRAHPVPPYSPFGVSPPPYRGPGVS